MRAALLLASLLAACVPAAGQSCVVVEWEACRHDADCDAFLDDGSGFCLLPIGRDGICSRPCDPAFGEGQCGYGWVCAPTVDAPLARDRYAYACRLALGYFPPVCS